MLKDEIEDFFFFFPTEYMDLCSFFFFFYTGNSVISTFLRTNVLSFPPAHQGCFSIKILIVSIRFIHCFKATSNN